MIGRLPTSLNVGGEDLKINTDFRIALLIFKALNDVNLNNQDKVFITLDSLYGIENIPVGHLQDAFDKAKEYLDCGLEHDDRKPRKKMIDWEQDETMIFSSVNKVAGMETRSKEHIHWWTWYGFFSEIGDGMLSSVLRIRQKRAKGKRLEKHEQEFYKENKSIIDFKVKYTDEEQQEIDRINELLNQ